MNLPPFIHIPDLARYITTSSGRGVTRQRAHHIVKHPDEGDNRERIKAALAAMRAELDNYLKDEAPPKIKNGVEASQHITEYERLPSAEIIERELTGLDTIFPGYDNFLKAD